MLKEVDLSLGFEYITASNYLRFPLWLTYICSPDDSMKEIRDMVNQSNHSLFRTGYGTTKQRNRFCCHISRHDNNGIRQLIINNIQKIGDVTCAGSFMRNTDELQTVFCDNKVEYLKQFKFNICPENSNSKGYVTEKLFEAILAGCIPIYWGGERKEFIEPEIINPSAILYFDPSNPKALRERVEQLHFDEKYYFDFIEKNPPFLPTAANRIHQYLHQLEEQLISVSKKDFTLKNCQTSILQFKYLLYKIKQKIF